MNKELDYINERIERLEFHVAHPNEYNITPTIKVKINDGAGYKEEVAILKIIKERLEALENSNPSEAMECWRWIDATIPSWVREKDKDHPDTLEPIKNALLKAQEMEKENQELKKKISNYERSIELYSSKQLESANFYLRNENAEYKKVLEILFKKQVDLGWLWYCIYECVDSLNEYNKKMPIEKFKLTQEEFDLLLKRWSEQ